MNTQGLKPQGLSAGKTSTSAAPEAQDELLAPSLSFWNRPKAARSALGTSRAAPIDLAHVCRLARDPEVCSLAAKHGLSVVDVAWEDTSRFANSCLGSNITDVTLRAKDYAQRCSIIRKPNFTDHTADFDIGQFRVQVGNEKQQTLQQRPLRDYLNQIFSNAGGPDEAIAASHQILVSAQTCVLPLHKDACEFNVELFNYQTSKQHPACLAIVCSAESTTAHIISERGAQKLFVNLDGQAKNFLAERLKVVREREGRKVEGQMSQQEEERNVLLVFQVPLKIPPAAPYPMGAFMSGVSPYAMEGFISSMGCMMESTSSSLMACSTTTESMPYGASRAGVGARASCDDFVFIPKGTEHAQLGFGKSHGKFEGAPDAMTFEIDPDAAIRCTVQHYLVSDTGKLTEADIVGIKETIDKIYGSGDKQGSLVVDADRHQRSTVPKGAGRGHHWFFA